MTPKDLNGYVYEYRSILRRASTEAWLAPLLRAHLTPCTKGEALGIVGHIFRGWPPQHVRVDFRIGRGRARVRRLAYAISLPPRPGPAGSGHVYHGPGGRSCGLRVGLVLHEAAHVLDHRRRREFGHGPSFCAHLRSLLDIPWSDFLYADPGHRHGGRHDGHLFKLPGHL